MKKKILAFVFVLVLIFSLPVSALAAGNAPRLYDGAGLLTSSEKNSLQTRLNSVSEQYQVEIVIATVQTTGHASVDTYVEYFYDQNGYGYGPDHDGVLLLIAMDEREYRILSNGLGASAISPDDIDDISDAIVSDLSSGDYADAFHTFIDKCAYQINGEIHGFPFETGKNLLISLAIGLAAALIVTGIMASQLRSVRKQSTASEYTRPGSMHVTTAHEAFLYRSVSKRERPQESSSSGSSGSSRNVGGGKF